MCKGYLGIVIQEDQPIGSPQTIDAHCLKCGWRIDWKLISGKFPAVDINQ
jgi:hypothetical protein